MEFSWEVVVMLMGGLTAFLSWLYAMLRDSKKPKVENINTDHNAQHMENVLWKGNLESEQVIIKEQIQNIRSEVEKLKRSIESHDSRTQNTIERFENRIEKFTDIIIEHLQK